MYGTSYHPSYEEFAQGVHGLLDSLYDPMVLRRHPLGAMLPVGTDPTLRGSGLRRLVLEAIHSLRPPQGTPAYSPAWRAYHILQLRYVEGLSPEEVMKAVALARTQYFHEQKRALGALVDTLWEKAQQTSEESNLDDGSGQEAREELVRQESERLSVSASQLPVSLVEVLDELSAVFDRLGRACGVSIVVKSGEPLQPLRVDRVLLRQAILNGLIYACNLPPRGLVEVSSFGKGEETGIRVVARLGAGPVAREDNVSSSQEGLAVCRQLVTTTGGMLDLEVSADHWEMRLTWLGSALLQLLVVDDDEGFVQLVRRYLVGHRWQVVGATSAQQARSIAAKVRPTAIVLDVLLPGQDGWELLAALKTEAATRDIPVIVCSAINQPQLASALGAAEHLPKPVTQQAVLEALARWE